MTDAASPAGAGLPPGPAPIALAMAYDLVTRYRLRLVDSRDSRLAGLGEYELATAAWTGPRAAFVGFYAPPADPAEAGRDLAARCEAARRWGHQRLQLQGAQVCDILLVALRPLTGALAAATSAGDVVRIGAAWVDAERGDAEVILPIPQGMPPIGELKAKARAVRDGAATPTLAAVDLAERQTVAGGYVAPVRRAMVMRPVVTYGFIALFVVAYIIEKLYFPTFVDIGVGYNGPPLRTDVWRYVSSAFLHDPTSYLHIIFNGLAMLWIGRLVEQLYGRLVLAGAFLFTAIVGNIVWVVAGAVGLAPISPSLGASGGISGLVGLLLMLGVVQGRNVPVGVARGVRNYALIVIVLNVVLGFGGLGGGGTVNNWVHGGGLAAGILVGLILPPAQQIGGRDLSAVEKFFLGAVIALGIAGLLLFGYQVIAAPPQLLGGGA